MDLHIIFFLASPSPEFSGAVFPECHLHLQSYLVHLIPDLSWIWWVTLACFFRALLDFSSSRRQSQFPLSFHFSASESVLIFDLWWPRLFLSHCPCCLTGILGRSGDKLMYLRGCPLCSWLPPCSWAPGREGACQFVCGFVPI